MNRREFEWMPQYEIFKSGSKTYFQTSLFFPPELRRDVFILYAFVRVADNFVDDAPQDEKGFADFCRGWERADCGIPSGLPIIDDFVDLSRRRGFESSWIRAFLASMAMDLGTVEFESLSETLAYIYGSAEVIGLFMSRIMGLPEAALPHARMLGRAMQYINFLRDIPEDNRLGRRYLPIGGSGLKGLSEDEARRIPDVFRTWFRSQSALYRRWHEEALKGYGYIPRRYLLPIRTAEDMYLWTAETLESDPIKVFQRKVKPKRRRILKKIAVNLFTSIPRGGISPVSPDTPGGIDEPMVREFAYVRGNCEDWE